MSRAHLQQIPLHETPVGPTAQLMASNVLVPSSLWLPIMEASFPSHWVGCVGWSGWGTVFLPDLHSYILKDGICQHISCKCCNYNLSLSPDPVLFLKTIHSSQIEEKKPNQTNLFLYSLVIENPLTSAAHTVFCLRFKCPSVMSIHVCIYRYR